MKEINSGSGSEGSGLNKASIRDWIETMVVVTVREMIP